MDSIIGNGHEWYLVLFWHSLPRILKQWNNKQVKEILKWDFRNMKNCYWRFGFQTPSLFTAWGWVGCPQLNLKRTKSKTKYNIQTEKRKSTTYKQKKEKQQTYRRKQVFLFFLKETKIMNLFKLSNLTLRHNYCWWYKTIFCKRKYKTSFGYFVNFNSFNGWIPSRVFNAMFHLSTTHQL